MTRVAPRVRRIADEATSERVSGAVLKPGGRLSDSSVIVALMSELMSEPVKTFSVGFAEAGAANELADASRVAEFFGTDHHELELSVADQHVDLEDLVWYLDEPLADLSPLGFYALSELAAQRVTVALSGQGADELLGGYERHRNAVRIQRVDHLPAGARRAAITAGRFAGGRFRRAACILESRDPGDRYVQLRGRAYAAVRGRLTRGPLAALDGHAAGRVVAAYAADLPSDPFPSLLALDARLGLVDDMLHYFDRTSMAHSLEVRVPFLDHHVVEYCATLPQEMKVRGKTTKWLLRHVAKRLIPHEILTKPKVGFLHNSADRWLQEQLRGPAAEVLLRPDACTAEFLDRTVLEELIAGTERHDPAFNHGLLAILMLEIWLSTFVPRARRQPGGLGLRA